MIYVRNLSKSYDKALALDGVRALIKENLRRFWPISLVCFIILFCTTVLPVMLTDSREAPMAISARNPVFVIISLLLPILAANAVFRYLYSSSGSTCMHAFPLSRRTLFKGSFLSGLILSFAPVFLAMLTVLPIAYMNTVNHSSKYIGRVSFSNGLLRFSDSYAVSPDISGWLLFVCLGLLILFFVYALAVFAAILTGMGSGQIALAFVLNFILVFLCLIVVGYLDTFLIGFSSDSWIEVFLNVNPLIYYTYSIYDRGSFSLLLLVVYFVIACLVIFAAGALYERRKLERAGSPICFSSAETAVIWLITLVSMAGLGIAFAIAIAGYNDYNKGGLVLGCVIGAVVAFMVMAMLTQKTPKVFTLKNLKAFGVFAIVGALFIAFTAFDVTGYTDRAPDPERVKSVKLTFTSYPFMQPYGEGYNYFGLGPLSVEPSSAHDIGAAATLHKGVLAAEKAYASGKSSDDYRKTGLYRWGGKVTFAYKLGGTAKMSRTYFLRNNYTSDALMEELAGIDAFREGVTLGRLVGYDKIVSAEYSYFGSEAGFGTGADSADEYDDRIDKNTGYYPKMAPEDKIRELVQCMDRDFLRLSVQELAGTAQPMPGDVAVFTLEFRESSDIDPSVYYMRSFTYVVSSSYSETLDFMKRSGF